MGNYEVIALVSMVFCGLALGLLAGVPIGWRAHKREVAEMWPGEGRTIGLRNLPSASGEPRDPAAPVLPDAQMNELWARVLDASLPKHPADGYPTLQTPGEYDEPLPDSSDWTDSIRGFEPERPLVAGLRPGEAIPGLPPIVEQWREMGEAAFDQMEAVGNPSAATVAGSWVEPIRLSDDELID